MSRIKMEDLPVLKDLNVKEIKGIFGGAYTASMDSGSDEEGGSLETSTYEESGVGDVDGSIIVGMLWNGR